MHLYQRSWFLLGGLWLLLMLIPLLGRTLIPIDETRYISVTWEMWFHGNWLVPTLNGEFYHHKPPFLFWLIHLGWAIFGVNEWWPRLLPAFFALANLWLIVSLARQLWPQFPQIGLWSAFILLSCALWSIFTSMLMFDMILAFFTLLGMVALVRAWQKHDVKAWGWFSIAIGLGILTKGPVILLHLLPIALLAPWWQRSHTVSRRFWYFGILSGVILGSLLALAWAIPAGIVGGEDFRQALFWGQTANRLINSFAHQHPFWWYLPLLPVILFPWLFWKTAWRGIFQLPQYWHDSGVRLVTIWLLFTLISFSLISGKQLHYLLPVLPAFALLLAYLLVQTHQQPQRWDTLGLGMVIILLGALLISVLFVVQKLPVWTIHISPIWGILLIILGSIVAIRQFATLKPQLIFLSGVSVLLSLLIPLIIIRAAGISYDLQKISQYISNLQQNKSIIAHFGKYYGQYHFLGHLQQPLPIVNEANLCSWVRQHPKSQLIVYFPPDKYQTIQQHVNYIQSYRSKSVSIIPTEFFRGACLFIFKPFII
jgi:4-amino-4-deoxy-L-arabinose transferase-like glycosyltransferase